MEFTARNVAKHAVKFTIQSVVATRVEDEITTRTSLEEDSIPVYLLGHTVGWFVSDRLKPHTDKMVDKTADWIAARRNKKSETDPTE